GLKLGVRRLVAAQDIGLRGNRTARIVADHTGANVSFGFAAKGYTAGKYATALGFLSNASAESASALGDQTTANIAGGV
ncbi:hypothetical protein, partial [Streptococcus salivarius]|uniref:hypothetical protein n=1 Tax=Streptococcus salivarius TaxID=1304 RepID=UPI001D070EF8